MSLPDSSPNPAIPSSPALVLHIRGVGNLIPFKNRKKIAGRRLVTEKRVKKQMKAITASFVSQLLSALATAGGATWTAAQRRSWIASRLPADDCWTIIPDEHVTAEPKVVPSGQEGATITLTRI